MIQRGKITKLYSQEKRKQAKKDFKERIEYHLQKKKLKRKELEEKMCVYNFKPRINKKRINLNPKKLHKNVYRKNSIKKTLTSQKIGSNNLYPENRNIQICYSDRKENKSQQRGINKNIKKLHRYLKELKEQENRAKDYNSSRDKSNLAITTRHVIMGRIDSRGSLHTFI